MSFYAFENDKELTDEVLSKLGAPMVKVELDDSHLQNIVKSTKRWFLSKKSIVSLKFGTWASDQSPIPFDDIDPVNGVYKIIEVHPDSTDSGSKGSDSTYNEILPHGYPIWGSTSHVFGAEGYNSSSFITQVFQSIERRRRAYGADLDWFVQEDHINGHSLVLTPVRRCRQYAVIYKPKTLPITALQGRDANLFYRWAVADAKETLGTIRNKYKDYPAAGGTVSTDGSELLDASKEEKEKLDEEIAGSQGPMPILFG